MSWLFKFVLQRALAKGSGRFAGLAVVLGLLRFVQKISGTGERSLYKHELRPGDVVIVRENKR
jgi:hypothetical protein